MKRLAWAILCSVVLLASAGQPVIDATAAPRPAVHASAGDACPHCPVPEPCSGCWQPPLHARWQYQLQARPGVADESGGIDVGICEVPLSGGVCVTPQVFDIDLYVDTNVSG